MPHDPCTTITLAEVLNEAKRQVATQPSRCYAEELERNGIDREGCRYTARSPYATAHCLVGYILKGLGLPIPGDGDPLNASRVSALYREMLQPNGFEFTPEAISFLQSLQERQDCGDDWENAVVEAQKEIENTVSRSE